MGVTVGVAMIRFKYSFNPNSDYCDGRFCCAVFF